VVESSAVRRLGMLVAVLGLALSAAAALRADASFALTPTHGAKIQEYEAGPSTTQAGGHPDLTVQFRVGTRVNPFIPDSCNCGSIKTAKVETPAGFIGDPHATPRCTTAQFSLDICPVDSQVGMAYPSVEINDNCFSLEEFKCEGTFTPPAPLYNLIPPPDQAGLLGFKGELYGFPIYTVLSARTGGDYGLNAEVRGIGQVFTLTAFKQVLWGVPASPVHDKDRYLVGGTLPGGYPQPSNSPERPFLSNPTTCAGPLSSSFTSAAFDGIEHVKSAPWPATTGCDLLGFNPSLSAQPSTSEADTASGLDVSLKVPQNISPVTPSASEIRATTVTLPEGFSVNPSAADGKIACTDAQARFGTTEAAQCPENSKVGTLNLLSSALPEAIPGAIYLGEPKPGNRYRLFIAADGFGTHVKLPGSVHPDPRTGQLAVTFDNLPQAPLTQFDMHFFGSERGLLATPIRCGSYPVNSDFTPWAGVLPNQLSTQFFKIDSGPGGQPCPGAQRPFAPSLRAAGDSNGAGSHASFSLLVNRADGDQNLNTITVKTPPGFAATLKGVPYCPEATLALAASAAKSGLAELAAPSCPAASQVGVASAGAGAGTRPLYVPGNVYLAGPYKGAPLSFAVVTPAVSGPYDLGNVIVRVAIKVDPTNAQVTAVSDPLPQILDGIPLRLRSIMFNLNRPNFTINPTNCSAHKVESQIAGTEGALATPSSNFQTANCDALAFAPKLTTTLTGSTKRRGYPALKAVLTQAPSGESNIARAAVTLPHSEFLAQEHIGTVCTRVQFAADSCPAASVYGSARAISPLLGDPLEGPVYLRSSSNPLPDLVAALKGPSTQPIEIDLVGRIDTVNDGIRTTFDSIPDAPVSKFVLNMKGGKKGLLVNSADICKGSHLVLAKITGQNGRKANQKTKLAAPCGSKKNRAKRPASSGRGAK
jgi:hypothetical protein